MKKKHPSSKSDLALAIRSLENVNYNVIPVTKDNGKTEYYVTRSGCYINHTPTFTPAELVRNARYFIGNVFVSKAKTNLKDNEHRKARTKERELLQPLQGDVDYDDEHNAYEDDRNAILDNKHVDDIWAYD